MTLLRSINSILQRTTEEQIREIILVDDNSDIIDSNLKKEISRIDKHQKVKILRNNKREGLIRYVTIKLYVSKMIFRSFYFV